MVVTRKMSLLMLKVILRGLRRWTDHFILLDGLVLLCLQIHRVDPLAWVFDQIWNHYCLRDSGLSTIDKTGVVKI